MKRTNAVIATLSALLAAFSGCATTVDGGDSETHWLSPCNTGADCRAPARCVCGLCTLECTPGSGCAGGPPGSSCTPGATALACADAGKVPAGLCLPGLDAGSLQDAAPDASTALEASIDGGSGRVDANGTSVGPPCSALTCTGDGGCPTFSWFPIPPCDQWLMDHGYPAPTLTVGCGYVTVTQSGSSLMGGSTSATYDESSGTLVARAWTEGASSPTAGCEDARPESARGPCAAERTCYACAALSATTYTCGVPGSPYQWTPLDGGVPSTP